MPSGALLSHLPALANVMRRAAEEAGEIILDHFDESGFAGADVKKDGSPVTAADRAAEAHIAAALAAVLPDVPVIGEEAAASGDIPAVDAQGDFFLVDPLDGTREFIEGREDFTVNIALVRGGIPVLGVVHAPALGETYWTDGEGNALRLAKESGKEKTIRCRAVPRGGHTVVASRSRAKAEIDAFLEEYKVEKLVRRGSSLKLCLVACGKADLYPCLAETCLWDTAAAQAVMEAAGGEVVDLGGAPLTYDPARTLSNPHFLARRRG